jgi:adenylosuccinate lyase
MPYILSEQIILYGVDLGYSRQDIHERLRFIFIKLKQESSLTISGDTIETIFKDDEIIYRIIQSKNISTDPGNYIGRAVQQVENFYYNN